MSAAGEPALAWASECALRVSVGTGISEDASARVRAAARALRQVRIPGLVDVTPAYATLLLTFDPRGVAEAGVESRVADAVRGALAVEPGPARRVEIPVCYDAALAPDLAGTASLLGLSPDELASAHAGATYRVCFLGFSPGFAYLSGLPARLAAPRLPVPRARVPAGSVGIGGEQTGVYPQATPGGWRLIGRTPLALFDAGRPEASLLRAGDEVRFRPIGRAEFDAMAAAERSASPEPGEDTRAPGLRVLDPGQGSSVQDLGRAGRAAEGVPRGGAADALALRAGNRLVGNRDDEAGVEMTLTGATVRFERGAVFALTGADADAHLTDERGRTARVRAWSATVARPGSVLRVGAMQAGARAYLCIAGGVRVPLVLGSRSTHAPSGLGGYRGRLLRAGDVLPLSERAANPGDARTASASVIDWLTGRERRRTLRVTPGAHAALLGEGVLGALTANEFRVTPAWDRAGARFEGPAIAPGTGRLLTEGVPPGAVQVPEDARPILLMPDGPTTGGYAVIACVIGADQPASGQLRPGDGVRFEVASREEALGALREQEAAFDAALPGVPPEPGAGP